ETPRPERLRAPPPRGAAPAIPAAPVSWSGDLHEAVVRLGKLIAEGELAGARRLADELRAAIRHPDVPRSFRRLAGELVRKVYQLQEDKDALLAFQDEELAALDDALCDAQGGPTPR
ncbi:MAG TPA: hypothetical protein VFT37_15255, partial [Telluria sp.]|nr:hypothetical protein [Telluria sp.]